MVQKKLDDNDLKNSGTRLNSVSGFNFLHLDMKVSSV